MAALQSAAEYYKGKLQNHPTLSRYNHFMGAISSAKGEVDKADHYYRQTMLNAPTDVSARNDFALHLAHSEGRKHDSIKELKKGLLITNESSLLHKNMAAMQGRIGDLQQAMHHATQARYLAPNDAMNHRNLARLHSTLGDTYTALQHNFASIDIEDPGHCNVINTSAYRNAAVQLVARGGSRRDALALMAAARTLEHKHITLDTTERSQEIVQKIKQRQKHQLEVAERERREAEEQRRRSEEEWKKIIKKW
ncbi:hypothetical protein EON64_07710 [archaeon]|nr:MAG: hypothetical protein EON64_07710 [archaeon]